MRLLTRSDFDGLACGTQLKELGIIDRWKFVHPKDIQDGLVTVSDDDVLANIPYVEGCSLWFDHHSSEQERLGEGVAFEGESRLADSCARVVYEYYGGRDRMPQFETMVHYVDKVDSGKLTVEEVLDPKGWILMGIIMDPRTGLGRFRNFRISNYALMEKLLDACRFMDIEEILTDPDVKERVDLFLQQDALFREMVEKHTRVEGDCIVTDLRGVEPIYTGSRFLVYSLYPEQSVSMWIVDGRDKRNCPIAMGHSIINRGSGFDVGSVLLEYGGGGHRKVGTCQVPYEDADRVIAQLVDRVNSPGAK